ncbi:MAG TPA: hypothetical protein PK829_01050 [Promineifilum sp.]|nr:hypothetical protein [Promineifilum sp.]
MMWLLFFLGASVFSSIFVLAAGIMSSRMNRHDNYVETFITDTREAPSDNTARTRG